VTPQQEHRDVSLGGSKLQAAGSYHRDLAGFGDHGGRRSIAYSILDHGEQYCIVARLCMNDVGGSQARLFEAGGIEVIAAADPQDRRCGQAGFARSDAGQEKRGRRVIDQRARERSGLVQGTCAQTAGSEAAIQSIDTKRHGPMISQRGRQRAEGIDARMRKR